MEAHSNPPREPIDHCHALHQSGCSESCAEQFNNVCAQLEALKSQLAALPAEIRNSVQSAMRQLEPFREVGVRELIPTLPPGMRSKASVYRGVAKKLIPHKKIRGRLVFDVAEVRANLLQPSAHDAIAAFEREFAQAQVMQKKAEKAKRMSARTT